jgi:hypothetical protein
MLKHPMFFNLADFGRITGLVKKKKRRMACDHRPNLGLPVPRAASQNSAEDQRSQACPQEPHEQVTNGREI